MELANNGSIDKKEIPKELFTLVGKDKEVSQQIVRPSLTYWQDAWRRLKLNPTAIVALVILILLGIMAVIGPMLVTNQFDKVDLNNANQFDWNFTDGHIFGTDELGRDLFVRVWMGARTSLMIGLIAAFAELVVGVIYGGISGYLGGKVDNAMMRVVDILLVIPEIVLMILISIVIGKGFWPMVLAISILHWLPMARIVRGQILQIKEQEFVLAARTLGASPARLIFQHLVPNTIGPIIVRVTFSIPAAIFFEAFLSFIGLGIAPPACSWGTLASVGATQLQYYPHLLIIPSLFICITMLSLNMLGDGLRDALDPRLRK